MVRGVTLQASDFHRVAFAVHHHAGALAERFCGADARATGTEDVRAQNRPRRAGQVPIDDLFDERWNVNSGRAGLDAGSIETKQAAVGLDNGFLRGVARRDFGQICRGGFLSLLRTDWHRQKVQCPREQARSFADFYCSQTEVWLESKNYKIGRRKKSVKTVIQDLYG